MTIESEKNENGAQTAPINISVAIPLLNEEPLVDELLGRLFAVLDEIDGDHQVVIVDDGSSDGTLAKLEEAVSREPRVFVVALSRNFGHQVAISAALDYADGDVVVVMDGDLQDSPEAIPKFVEAFRKGYDVVYAVRANRKENFIKRICYKSFYRIMAYLVSIEVPLDSGDFGLMSRRVVDLMRQTHERQRFLRGLRTWYGFEQIGVVVDRESRYCGRSKYSFLKLLRLAFDGIFSFSIVPIRLAIFAGAAAICVSGLYSAYAIYVKLNFAPSEQAPLGFTAIIVSVTFLSGVHLMFAGIIGEYVGRIYEEVKRRPLYVVKRTIGETK